MTDKTSTDINLSDPQHIECPYHAYQALHQTGGVGRDPNIGVVVAGYDTLAALAKNTEVYSSSITEDGHGPRHMGINPEPVQDDVEEILSHAHPIVNALFTADPPVHTRHRKLIAKALSPRSVRALEPQIRAITNDLIDAFITRGSVDLLPEFAVPLPVTVIADILGVDRADIWTFKHWGDLMISGNIDMLSHERRREVAKAVVELHEYFVPRIEERRRNPTDDLLSIMINTEVDGEPPLTTAELLPIIDQILLAGHETTTNLIANAMLVLLNDPDLMRRLRDNPSDIPAMVEEALRWDRRFNALLDAPRATIRSRIRMSPRATWSYRFGRALTGTPLCSPIRNGLILTDLWPSPIWGLALVPISVPVQNSHVLRLALPLKHY